MPSSPTGGIHVAWVRAYVIMGYGPEPGVESPTKISVQKRPTAKQIQPTGLLGCLEAIRAPTTGKARKGTKIISSPRVPPVLVGSCEEKARTCNKTLARNMATQRPASDHASQEAVRLPSPPTPRLSCRALSVTTPLYSTTVSRALRLPLRGAALRKP